MQKTIQRATTETVQPADDAPRRRWRSVVVVAVLGGLIGLGLAMVAGGSELSPHDIAEIRAERMVDHHAELWARQFALTPQEIAERRAAQYPEAYKQIWESQQP